MSAFMDKPFWERKTLADMSKEEWESLCDRCGNCCLHKLEDEDTGRITPTRVACRLLDLRSCRCGDYANRSQHVPDCIKLTPRDVLRYRWLPATCAYRLLAEGKPLPPWHPLLSDDAESVHRAGISVRGKAISETDVHPDDLENYVVDD